MKSKLLGKTFLVLEEMAAAGVPLSLKALSGRLGIHSSTLSRICGDLVEAGHLRKTSYHEFEPSLGLIYLGQRTMVNWYLPKKVNKLLSSRCKATGLDCAMAGLYKDRLVYLYNSSHESSNKTGMPYINHPHASNIALVVLTKMHGGDKTLKTLGESLRRNAPNLPFEERMKFFKDRIAQFLADGCSLWEERNSWNACVPVLWQNETFGLSFYASRETAGSKARLAKEASLAAERIGELLLNREDSPPK